MNNYYYTYIDINEIAIDNILELFYEIIRVIYHLLQTIQPYIITNIL